MPVLVTGPLLAAVVPPIACAPVLAALLGAGVALFAGVVPPTIAAELVETGGGATAVVRTGLGEAAACDVVTGWLVVTETAPETVMVTVGLPPPQSAVTVYWPEAFEAIIAVPEKLIEVVVTDAAPPTNADE
jgi:hypothetical protein